MPERKAHTVNPETVWISGAEDFRLSMSGERRLRLENHRGLKDFSPERIRIKSRRGFIIISGRGLYIEAMRRRELIICGRIENISVEAADE